MKITIYKQEEGKKFLIQFDEQTPSGQGHGFAMTLDVEDVRTLNEMITNELEKLDAPEEEMVWNPRSQRHEKRPVEK